MGDEPRFPPPNGQEPIGYREAGAPISDEKPELPIPSGPIIERKRVVASRPDDPDVALAKAYTPPRRPVKQASIGATLFVVLMIVVYVYFEMRHC
jgi:hypothetical protein